MIPKLDISIPELFLRCFHFPTEYPQEKLDADIKELKEFYDERGKEILEKIEKLSGFSWIYDRVPIYLVPRSNVAPAVSFCKFNLEEGVPGVILKIGRGKRDQWILIHELVHVNQKQKEWFGEGGYAFKADKSRNNDLLELGADLIALYIMRDLFGDNSECEKDFWDFLDHTQEKNKRKGGILRKYMDMWNLNENNLKYYLDKNRSNLEQLI